MKLLVLGGTKFLGRHFVEAAIKRGHDLTLFNRGRTDPAAFRDVETVVGDRDGGLAPLRDRTWDAVLDTCGYDPRVVRQSAQRFRGTPYAFVSTVSVYPDITKTDLDERADVMAEGGTYGPLKALCEREVESPSLIVRPGLIVGPRDPSDRFTYWVRRVARGGVVLAPGRPHRRVQYVDVRDLAEWLLRSIETGLTGLYNATGPGVAMQQVLETCRTVTEGNAHFVWVGDDFLRERGAAPYTDLPLWIPGADDGINIRRATTSGLGFRTLADTVRDTFKWDRVRSDPLKAGLTAEREAEILAAWRKPPSLA